jgi:hypothetical protein
MLQPSSLSVVIYSEHPTDDIWMRLARFTYDANLRKHVVPATGAGLTDDARREVAASIEQSREYFKAATEVSLHTAPLQLYYGMTNLLKATTILLNGSCAAIGHHGMTMPPGALTASPGNAKLHVNGGAAGGLLEYASAIQPGHQLSGGQVWTLSDLLASVPELADDWEATYGPGRHCVPIERVMVSPQDTADRIDIIRFPDYALFLKHILGLSDRYLRPQATATHIVLRTKLTPIDDITHVSLSGKRFLLVAHEKSGASIALSPMVASFMAMFVLGTVSRYHAQWWSSFVNESEDNERHIVELFVRLAVRLVPNIALDTIERKRHVFTTAREQNTDLREFVVTNEVKEIVSKEVTEALRQMLQRSQT